MKRAASCVISLVHVAVALSLVTLIPVKVRSLNPWFVFLPLASARHRSGSLHSGCWAPVCPIRSNPWTSPLEDGSSLCDKHVCGYALGLTSSLLLDTLPGFAASGIPGLLCKLRVYQVSFHGCLPMWPCGRWCWDPICTSWFPHLCSYAFPTIIR